MLRAWCAFSILTSKCVSPHNALHFFVHLDFQKCSEPEMFFNMLTSKYASYHSRVHFLNISTSKSGPTMRCLLHFHFKICFAPQRRAIFISHLTRWLRTRRFSKPTFRASGAPKHWKNTMFRDFSTFLRTFIFFLLALSLFTPFLR